MKKFFTAIAMIIGLTSFATPIPAWDAPLQMATNPYVSNHDVSQYGSGAYRKLRVQMTLNTAATFSHKMTVSVYGNWYGSGVGYKYYDVIMPIGHSYKYTDFPLHFSDVVYVAMTNLEYDGPE